MLGGVVVREPDGRTTARTAAMVLQARNVSLADVHDEPRSGRPRLLVQGSSIQPPGFGGELPMHFSYSQFAQSSHCACFSVVAVS
jgi:hypothetical protein